MQRTVGVLVGRHDRVVHQVFGDGTQELARNIIFFIDNQSMCRALTKGTSKSRDIQHLATAWHFFTLQLRCRIWIEWVPSESNPADKLSREYKAPFVPSSSKVDDMLIPEWTNQTSFGDIRKMLDVMSALLNEGASQSSASRETSEYTT